MSCQNSSQGSTVCHLQDTVSSMFSYTKGSSKVFFAIEKINVERYMAPPSTSALINIIFFDLYKIRNLYFYD